MLARRQASVAAATLALTLSASAGMAQAPGGAMPIPDGPGKDLVQGVCTACHQTREIVNSLGYSKDGWKELIGTMIDLSKTPDQQDQITSYLASHFPPGKTRRASKQVKGDLEITFKEWTMPSLGQRSRDPVEGPDGKIWYVGQWGNVLGWINPTTNEIREYPLPSGSKPHTVTLDKDGVPWWSGNANGTVGKTDPATGQHTVYKMPDPKARDPHTMEFDRNGILWFSLQQSNMIGRLDPKTGEIKLAPTVAQGAKPYGVKFDSKGNVWMSCNGAPCLIKIDPVTMQQTEVKLPWPRTTVRRLAIDSQDRVWYVNSGMGRLGMHDPKTGEIKEWDSPSGQNSHPYAITVVDDIIWYNESAVRPDMLVRFDPKTQQFQSWPIPTGGIYAGMLRHMRPDRNGNLLIHQSATNRIIRVTTRPPLTR